MRISTTVLESFRLFNDPDQEWMTEADLIATIRGEFVPTPQVIRGKAFGKILETPDVYRVSGGYICDHVSFGDDVMGPALALIDRPHTVFEAKAIAIYAGHEVVAKADQLCGADLIETKTTESFDFDKYAQSCQWTFMADIFKPKRITYHVFVLSESDSNHVISLRSVESFHLFPYAEMRRECERLVQEFDTYVTARDLKPLLEARQVALAGAF